MQKDSKANPDLLPQRIDFAPSFVLLIPLLSLHHPIQQKTTKQSGQRVFSEVIDTPTSSISNLSTRWKPLEIHLDFIIAQLQRLQLVPEGLLQLSCQG